MSSPREEFVFKLHDLKQPNGKNEEDIKWYDISQLDRFDDILWEDNRKMWERIQRGYQKEIVVDVYIQEQKKYEKEPKKLKLTEIPVEDAKRKFG